MHPTKDSKARPIGFAGKRNPELLSRPQIENCYQLLTLRNRVVHGTAFARMDEASWAVELSEELVDDLT